MDTSKNRERGAMPDRLLDLLPENLRLAVASVLRLGIGIKAMIASGFTYGDAISILQGIGGVLLTFATLFHLVWKIRRDIKQEKKQETV